MIDAKTLVNLSNWQDNNPDYPFFFAEHESTVINAIGNDCEKFIDFIRTTDTDMLLFLSQFTEAITESFNYDDKLLIAIEEHFPH